VLPVLDLTGTRIVQYLKMLWAAGPFRFVACVKVMNLFNHPNLAGYSYTPDYSQRLDNPSYFSRRIAVVGVTVMW